jgi:hypothetical protein
MQIKLFYKSSSPEDVSEKIKPLEEELKSSGSEAELIDVDTPKGAMQQELYDVTNFPAAVVTGPDGSLISEWKGFLPPASELRYWLGGV